MPHHVITICSSEDAAFQKEMDRALAAAKRAGLAVVRNAADFADDAALVAAIDDADVVVVLLTPALVNSPLWNGVAMQAVQAAHERQPLPVVPVLVQPCAWRDSWLSRFSGLPRNGRALSDLRDGMVAGWAEIGAALQAVFKSRSPRTRAAPAPERQGSSGAAAPAPAVSAPAAVSAGDLAEVARAYQVLDRYHAALLRLVDSARRASEDILGPLQNAWSPGKLQHPVHRTSLSSGADEHTPLKHVSYVWTSTSWIAAGGGRVVLVHDGDGASGAARDGGGGDRAPRPRLSVFATFATRVRTAGDQHPSPWEAADREIASAEGFSAADWEDGKVHAAETGGFGLRFGGFTEDVGAILGAPSPEGWIDRLRALVAGVKGR